MTVLTLDHVNLRAVDPPKTIAFFRDVLRMSVAPLPNGAGEDRGGWVLDSAGRAIVHVGLASSPYLTDGWMPASESTGSGAVHHIALGCEDFDAMKLRLEHFECRFTINEVPQFNLRQLFVTDPNGILFELNFHLAG